MVRYSLICGLVSSLLYVAMNVFLPMRFAGYNSASQGVSELSAIGAPTRPLWVPLGITYAVLMVAFAWGILASAGRSRPRRIAGALLLVYALISVVWPFAPMHLRGEKTTLSDTMHIVFTMATVLCMFLAIGFGAAAFRTWFRFYSIITAVVLIAFGALTGLDAPGLAANQPTPLLGVWERINIGVFLLWVGVLATLRLRALREEPEAGKPPRVGAAT